MFCMLCLRNACFKSELSYWLIPSLDFALYLLAEFQKFFCPKSFFPSWLRWIHLATTFAMTSHGDQDYGMLEAVTNQRYTHNKPLPENSGMQVVPDYGKQVNNERTGLEVAAKHQYRHQYPANSGEQHHQSRRPRQKWLIIGGIAALLIVVAAILGGVLGSRANKKSPPTSSSTPSTPSSSNASTTAQRQHNLAALSFALNTVYNTRVYYQDNAGEIVEAASSAANSTWINTSLGFFAKNGSAIGAAVSRPGFAHVSLGFLPGQAGSDLRAGNYSTVY